MDQVSQCWAPDERFQPQQSQAAVLVSDLCAERMCLQINTTASSPAAGPWGLPDHSCSEAAQRPGRSARPAPALPYAAAKPSASTSSAPFPRRGDSRPCGRTLCNPSPRGSHSEGGAEGRLAGALLLSSLTQACRAVPLFARCILDPHRSTVLTEEHEQSSASPYCHQHPWSGSA